MKKILFILSILMVVSLPYIATADLCPPASTSICNPIGNPIPGSSSGTPTTVPDFVKLAMEYVGTIIGLMAIIMVVYSGIRLVISNGDPAKIKESRTALTYTIIGFVVSVMAYAGVAAVENFLGVSSETPAGPNELFNPFGSTDLPSLVGQLLQRTIEIAGLVALFMIILNGFRYITSRGDSKKIDAAKSGLTWSIIGLIVILFAYVIIKAIATLVG